MKHFVTSALECCSYSCHKRHHDSAKYTRNPPLPLFESLIRIFVFFTQPSNATLHLLPFLPSLQNPHVYCMNTAVESASLRGLLQAHDVPLMCIKEGACEYYRDCFSSVKRTAAVGLGAGESLCVCSGVCMCVNGNPVDPDDLSVILYECACWGSGGNNLALFLGCIIAHEVLVS